MKWRHETDSEVNIEDEIFSCLRKIINTVELYSSKLKDDTGLTASQLSCLLVLKNTGPLPLSKISKQVALSPSMITSIVDQLEKKGLVTRTRKSADRRVILIELTDKGKNTANNAPAPFQEQLIASLVFLEQEEKFAIHKSLERILSIIVSEVLAESPLLAGENKLVEVAPSALAAPGEGGGTDST